MPMMNKPFRKRSFLDSFRDAAIGVWKCIKLEKNMRIHITMLVYMSALGFALQLSRGEFAALFLAIALVISMEMINTAIEKLCDFSKTDYDKLIRVIKDISAGAVLVSSVFSVFVGIAVFGKPELWTLIKSVFASPATVIIILLSLAASFLFIGAGPQKIWNKINKRGL